ncbi:MAG: acyltransferase [Brachymonas sp.]|jgi:UDP-2-acetamido-3-amino-2,3-dideoxy-glucuronate N-acetyltransferase
MNDIYIHPLADVRSESIGGGTRIWQYSVIFDGAQIGYNCNICAHTLIESKVVIGNNVTIKSGVYIWDGTCIEDDVHIGANATFTNDLYPRSKVYSPVFVGPTLRKGCSIGANATLLPGVIVGEYALVGAGAVVTKSVPPKAVVIGNPAKVIRFLP